ncbi:MAG: hypothetical protein JW703_05060 [Candidatus Diapherotrites archaeon]|nr:hypothetical protein [Candidatus Diapherotrites archaeon]
MVLSLKLRNALKKFAVKVLDVDETSVPRNHLDLLNDFKKKFEFDEVPHNIEEFLDMLRKKHLVDSISVASTDGSLISSSNGNGLSESLTGSALFNYLKSEMPKSEVMLIKEKDWFMVFFWKQKLFIVRSPSNLSPTELTILAKEIEEFVSQHKKTAN